MINSKESNLTQNNLSLPKNIGYRNILFYNNGIFVDLCIKRNYGSIAVDKELLMYDMCVNYFADKNIFHMEKSHVLEHCLIPNSNKLKYADKLSEWNLYTNVEGVIRTDATIYKPINYLYDIKPDKENLINDCKIIDDYNVDALNTLLDTYTISPDELSFEKEAIKSELRMSLSKDECCRNIANVINESLYSKYVRANYATHKVIEELKNKYNFTPVYQKEKTGYDNRAFIDSDVDAISLEDLHKQASAFLYKNSVNINMKIDSKLLEILEVKEDDLYTDEGVEKLLNMLLPNFYPLLKISIKQDKDITLSDREYEDKKSINDLVNYKVIEKPNYSEIQLSGESMVSVVDRLIQRDDESINSNAFRDIENLRVIKFLYVNKFEEMKDLIIANPKDLIKNELMWFIMNHISKNINSKFRLLQNVFYTTYVDMRYSLDTEIFTNYRDLKLNTNDFLGRLPLKNQYRVEFKNHIKDASIEMSTENIESYINSINNSCNMVVSNIDRNDIKKNIYENFLSGMMLRIIFDRSHSYVYKQKEIYGSTHEFIELIDSLMDKDSFANITTEQIKYIVDEVTDEVISECIEAFKTSETKSVLFTIK